MIDLTGKNALVIGGTRGIGEGITLAFVHAGANVIATSRDPEKVTRTAAAIRQLGGTTQEIVSDVTDLESLKGLFATVQETWGKLDILVNSQGTQKKIPAHQVEDEVFDRIMDANLRSVFRACREAYPLLKASRGCIINLASMASFMGIIHAAPYTASKGGVAQLTKALAVDWASDGIRCNAIAPGWIVTPLTQPILEQPEYGEPIMRRIPMKRFGVVEDVAGAALYLASDLARYVTGSILVVDGGVLAGI
jgi:NAD(P)-dependent dehydrogenase (short-subunit alcohol dehydrogenase family)